MRIVSISDIEDASRNVRIYVGRVNVSLCDKDYKLYICMFILGRNRLL